MENWWAILLLVCCAEVRNVRSERRQQCSTSTSVVTLSGNVGSQRPSPMGVSSINITSKASGLCDLWLHRVRWRSSVQPSKFSGLLVHRSYRELVPRRWSLIKMQSAKRLSKQATANFFFNAFRLFFCISPSPDSIPGAKQIIILGAGWCKIVTLSY